MKNTSTADANPAAGQDPEDVGDDHPTDSGHTVTSVKGEKSPRLPHERDESSDTGDHKQREQMRTAHDDAESPKQVTDKSEGTDRAYASLRGKTPGKERDTGAS